MLTRAPSTSDRRYAATILAEEHGGAVSRDLLATIGVDDRMVRREVRAGRWKCHGRQTVAVHTSDLADRADRWRAVWEVGTGIAALDGVTALHASGLVGFTETLLHVSVKHTAGIHSVPGLRIHKVIRRVPDEILTSGVPRTRPAVAAVRAARWAKSDRQAALVMVMPVQQGLCSGRQLVEASRLTQGRNRRRLIKLLARDIADGAQSLGELDFAAMCRGRGLPEPSRQAVRRVGPGTAYLDAAWDDIGLAVEIDGSGHRAGLAVAADNLRQNELALMDETILRIDLVGLRVNGDRFMDQVCRAHSKLSGSR